MKIVWLIGNPGAGKTTLAANLSLRLQSKGYTVASLDADRFWEGKPRTFTEAGRIEASATVAQAIADDVNARGAAVGVVSTCAPSVACRDAIRAVLGDAVRFVVVQASKDTLKRRRAALYADAEQGNIDWVDFEPCADALAVVDTDKTTPGAAAVYVINAMQGKVQGLGDLVKAFLPDMQCGACNRRRLALNAVMGRRGLR